MQKETMGKIMRFVTGGVIGLTYIILTKPRKEIISAKDAWARELGESRMGYLCGRTKAWEKVYKETEDQEFNSKIANEMIEHYGNNNTAFVQVEGVLSSMDCKKLD